MICQNQIYSYINWPLNSFGGFVLETFIEWYLARRFRLLQSKRYCQRVNGSDAIYLKTKGQIFKKKLQRFQLLKFEARNAVPVTLCAQIQTNQKKKKPLFLQVIFLKSISIKTLSLSLSHWRASFSLSRFSLALIVGLKIFSLTFR